MPDFVLMHLYWNVSRLKYNFPNNAAMYAEIAAEAGIKTIVLHPSSEPISDDERASRLTRSKNNIMILAELCRKYDFPNNAAMYAEIAAEAGVELWSLHLPFSGELDIS